MRRAIHASALLVGLACLPGMARAIDCSNLPTQFTGNEFPSGDFFSNFSNPCYYIPFPSGQGVDLGGDLNAKYWQLYYKVDPRYQLIILGSFPNARYFSITGNDDHYAIAQSILDADIVPLTSNYVNPYQPYVAFVNGQQYAVPINFGGAPGALQTGCMMNGFNVDVNALDAAHRHQGMNWNTDPGVFQAPQNFPLHIVDTPERTNPPRAGYITIRAYVDITTGPQTPPNLIVRDVASGCAYPAAYAQQTLQIVAPDRNTGTSWLDGTQEHSHSVYDNVYLAPQCYGTDPRNALSWYRGIEFVPGGNPYSSFIKANIPSGLPDALAAAGEVMRFRLRVPAPPPTPCTNGCWRSGDEQIRYTSLSFLNPGSSPLASLVDNAFVQDANGYATLIVGTGAAIPSWITAANGYTFLDLTALSGYQNLLQMVMRNILPSVTFACSGYQVPYNTTVYTPQGGLMGDYLPVVDYPLAASLPPTASPLVGPNACGVLPIGQPAQAPNCGVLPSNPIAIAAVPAASPTTGPVAAQPLPPIAITGDGFGIFPNGLPFTGNSNYLRIADITQNWSAGYTASACNVSIINWTSNHIELIANVNQNGLCPLVAGDQLTISVWNPQTLEGPATATVTVTPTNPSYVLGSSSALVGSAGGGSTVLLMAGGSWTAASNTSWLHLPAGSAGGVGSALLQFSCDANLDPGARIGTLTIAGLTFTVTQAGASFVPINLAAPLSISGLNNPQSVAVDGQGNLYIADTGNNAIKKWNALTGQTTVLVSSGLKSPAAVAVDGYRNVFLTDSGHNAIKQWLGASQQVVTLVSGLSNPSGVAVDLQGNVYFSDTGNNAIDQWSAANHQVTTLTGPGLINPQGVAVGEQGNVYFADSGNNAVDQWAAANGQVTSLLSTGLNAPTGVAVDGQGNVYLADTGNNSIRQWNAASQQVATLSSPPLNGPMGTAVDGFGNVYVADTGNNAIQMLSLAYLSLGAASLNEGPQAGTDSVTAQVLPATTPLAASSNQPWLTITSVAGGLIGFSFQANPSVASRTANITVLGQSVAVTQAGDAQAGIAKSAGDGQQTSLGQTFPAALQVIVTDAGGVPVQGAAVLFSVTPGATGASGTFGAVPAMPILTDRNGNATSPLLTANGIEGQFTVAASVSGLVANFTLTNVSWALTSTSVVVGSAAGVGTVLLITNGPWMAASNASWLHVSPGSASGFGSAQIQFSYDATSILGAQTGTLTIAGLIFTVTQAGASYTPVTLVNTLALSGLNVPRGVAVDGQGNVYIADTGDNALKQWSASTQQVAPLGSGLSNPASVAVDRYGNLFVADSGNHAIEEWSVASQQLAPLVSGVSNPFGVAVDWQGNIYFSDTGNNAIEEWNAVSQQVTTLIGTGLSNPTGVAVDGQGNVYFADTGNNAIKMWNPASPQGATTLVGSGLSNPSGVAVDPLGNVYIADTGNNAIKQWNAGSQLVSMLLGSGISGPTGVAVDAQQNVYVADTNNNAIKKLTLARVSLSATLLNESVQAGTDSVTVQVLPAGTPLAALSDQPWLTITTVAGGVIGFAFQANTSVTSRAAHVMIMGQQVTVMQSGDAPATLAKSAGDVQSAALGQAFLIPLQVTVTDAGGIPVQGAAVTFIAATGATGASATFAAVPTMPVLTDQNGQATAPVLTANATGGTFSVTAGVSGLSVTFTLTNLAYTLGRSSGMVGSAAGYGSVLLLAGGPWSTASNTSWLHVSAGSLSGVGNALIQFSYDANLSPGVQTGTLTVSGLTFTVTQAGAGFNPASLVQALVSSGLKTPQAVAVDGPGNLYLADTGNNTIKLWSVNTQQVTTLVPSGLNTPTGVAVDGRGNVYIADNKNSAIKKWSVSTGQVTSVVSGLTGVVALAVDSQGNIYFSEASQNAIKEWVASNRTVMTLVSSGLSGPRGLAVDALGNVYIADTKNNAIKEWTPAGGPVVTLVSSGLNAPYGVAVDGEGNLYIADTGDNAIKQWSPASRQVNTLVSSGLKAPGGVAVDGQGNVYIADTNDNAIKKFTGVWLALGAASRNEGPQAGTDSVNAQVLPPGTPLTAQSNQSWLTITGTGGGSIGFSYLANTSVNARSAQITVLSQQLTVTQSGDIPANIATTAGNRQSTPAGHAFVTALQVRVKDAAGLAVQAAAVTFTVVPGPGGAGGAFSSSPPMPILTNSSGYATAPALTANGIAGTFTVRASVGGASATATFSLTISP